MKKASAALALLVAFALLPIGAEIVSGEERKVSGTDHDVAIPGSPTCVNCHIPWGAEGEVLWASKPNTTGEFAGLRPLCFSCHDGTVTPVGAYGFDLSRPLHLRNPGIKGEDCDRCHDAHGTPYPKFLKLPGGADFCQNCHSRAGPGNHPVDISARAAGLEPVDSQWDPYRDDFRGTRLWNEEGIGPGDYVKCLSCHATHGGEPGTEFNTLPYDSSDGSSPSLCHNCHFTEEESWP